MKLSLAHPISLSLAPLIQGTCYHPDVLTGTERISDGKIELEFQPHMADMKFLVGRGGRQSTAYRHLVASMGKRIGIEAKIEFRESFVGQQGGKVIFSPDPDFSVPVMIQILMGVCDQALGFIPGYSCNNGSEKVSVRLEVPEDKNDIVLAIADVFYPYGFRNGRKVKIRSTTDHSAPALG